jgi:hypothetical protein
VRSIGCTIREACLGAFGRGSGCEKQEEEEEEESGVGMLIAGTGECT